MALRGSPRRLCTAAVILAVAACADDTPLDPGSPNARRLGAAPTPPGRYLVGFDGPAAISPDVLAAAGGRVVEELPAFNVLVVDGVTNPDALRAAAPKYIEASFDVVVDAAREEMPLVGAAVPGAADAPWYVSNVQWDMKAMKADEGWAITDGGQGINVCVMDTGIDAQHQELSGKVLLRTNFVTTPGENRVDDPNGHGSHVAGMVAARGVVVSGVAPAASILGARVLNAAGSGNYAWFVSGMQWCADNGAHVINASLGSIIYRGTAAFISLPITLNAAIEYATSRGVVVVLSGGNNNLLLPNPAQQAIPSELPGALTVGATGPLTKSTAPPPPAWDPFNPDHVWQGPDTKAFYSNFGPSMDVFAPGGRGSIPLSSIYRFVDRVAQGSPHDAIWSLCSGQSANSGAINGGGVPASIGPCSGQTNRYINFNGTSMAAPHVAGMAAVLYGELDGVRSPENRARVMSCILGTTDDIGDPAIYGGGRVNVRKAVDALRSGSC